MTLALVLTTEAKALIDAFRATEQPEVVGAMIIDDGFSAEAVRVLVAWMSQEPEWTKPPRPMPDNGKPTMKAWAWLVGGMEINYVAIADAADVSTSVARAKLAQFLGVRVIYPDGTIAKVARAAIQAAVAARVKTPKQQPKADKKPKTDGAN